MIQISRETKADHYKDVLGSIPAANVVVGLGEIVHHVMEIIGKTFRRINDGINTTNYDLDMQQYEICLNSSDAHGMQPGEIQRNQLLKSRKHIQSYKADMLHSLAGIGLALARIAFIGGIAKSIANGVSHTQGSARQSDILNRIVVALPPLAPVAGIGIVLFNLARLVVACVKNLVVRFKHRKDDEIDKLETANQFKISKIILTDRILGGLLISTWLGAIYKVIQTERKGHTAKANGANSNELISSPSKKDLNKAPLITLENDANQSLSTEDMHNQSFDLPIQLSWDSEDNN